ncbi:hypothetical protein RFI_04974 [Reticulomyxa filosa]|uniref:Uncharacterized protein n=1 Tax=Reticulomyxa filosa TaxID=46433 RepID=X6P247_RETFI|nr:hypothetical protein RFI_04974 [Reticulomyxa filosa]|eukprot:ETO32144.1 hypothetical protein RFI_04974 [Reticulomyxa filosa]
MTVQNFIESKISFVIKTNETKSCNKLSGSNVFFITNLMNNDPAGSTGSMFTKLLYEQLTEDDCNNKCRTETTWIIVVASNLDYMLTYYKRKTKSNETKIFFWCFYYALFHYRNVTFEKMTIYGRVYVIDCHLICKIIIFQSCISRKCKMKILDAIIVTSALHFKRKDRLRFFARYYSKYAALGDLYKSLCIAYEKLENKSKAIENYENAVFNFHPRFGATHKKTLSVIAKLKFMLFIKKELVII